MERSVLLLRPEQRKKLAAMAKREKVSVAEIHRRAIDSYVNAPKEDLEELSALVDILLRSNEEAKEALNEAEAALIKTLASVKKRKDSEDKHGSV